jgi:phosphomevalonate kinase
MDEYDDLNSRLKEVVKKFKEWRESGMDEEILVIYLHDKLRMSRNKVYDMLNRMDEFYEKLVKEKIIRGLKDE